MSTFNGLVPEFPDIRIDFFRRHPNRTPPLACFLSHVHSDHLAGLESLRSPFVYCSSATREILLRLEKYTCRIDYVRGVLEARQLTYKHLRKVLKALPLEAPTTIELRPGYKIQVTLFDANHCPGSTMFLIEGQEKAILYTGDVRAEPWFVNSIARNPSLLEYTYGLKTLDKLYLDTSFIEDFPFQTKSEGIASLFRKVQMYPPDTIFHLQAWTFGYEDVWIALSKALKSRIHVDAYKFRIFRSLNSRSADAPFSPDFHLTNDAAALNGHMCGNSQHPGCLTSDQDVRIHSCEKANMCSVAKKPGVVSIRPVVFRLPNGESILEAGVGGGGQDFSREAELDWIADNDIEQLLQSVPSYSNMDSGTREELRALLQAEASSGRRLSLKMTIDEFDDDLSTGLKDALWASIQSLFGKFCSGRTFEHDQETASCPEKGEFLPIQQRITPDPGSQESSSADTSHCCRPPVAESAIPSSALDADQNRQDRLMTEPLVHADIRPEGEIMKDPAVISDTLDDAFRHATRHDMTPQGTPPMTNDVPPVPSKKRKLSDPHDQDEDHDNNDSSGEFRPKSDQGSQRTNASTDSFPPLNQSLSRYEAYQAMLSNSVGTGSWMPISLLSTDANHGVADKEL
ncbi:hypothetical protein E4U42_002117 [Claviceps africana]|uniref:Metallo-beta-lactamase domain-containing protein n=1 Tax=Claviceps africana TaxID=83212 RepID=A0A8K0NJS0_9HYPO|nr:hypothetical protein E4U42_002117 [Claviceps africana]